MTCFARHFVVAAVAGGVGVLGVAAMTATAGITGPCSASIAGTNVASYGTGATDKAITVGHDSSVPVVLSASGRLTHVRITMEFAGFSWVVKDKTVSTPVYRDTIPVKDYATYGVGLYKVKGVGTGPGLSCSGSALVRVKGNPFLSVAGGVGLGAALLGAAGVLFGGIGARGGIEPFRLARSSLAGLIAAFGVLVLLQQAAILYPTPLVAIVGLVLGVALGTAAAVGPLFGHRAAKGTGVTGRPATPGV
jgi:hypothetical protein